MYYLAQQPTQTRTQTSDSPPRVTPSTIGLGMVILALAATSLMGNGTKKKNRLAKGRWGGKAEKTKAMNMALAMMQRKDHDAVAVCLERPKEGQKIPDPTPKDVKLAQRKLSKQQGNRQQAIGNSKSQSSKSQSIEPHLEQNYSKKRDKDKSNTLLPTAYCLLPKKKEIKKSSPPPSLPIYLTDMNRGTMVIGAPGTGKSLLTALPIIYSLLDQGIPLIIYDFKYEEQKYTPSFVGHAAKRGYDVRIFAPGYPESEVCNPLEFLDPEDPSMMAGQFADVLNRNFRKEGQERGEDRFFATAGNQLVQGVLMLAHESPYPDMMMCQSILSLPNLPKRIERNRDRINFLTYLTFSTLLASASSEKQVAGIIVTASNHFTQFMKPKVLSAFSGKSTIPMDLRGKKLIVLGLDMQLRDILAPLQATITDLLVTRNLAKSRSEPLAFINDEAPTWNLPRMVNWLNEGRSNGFVGVNLFQNLVQMERTYGKELTRAMITGSANLICYNTLEHEAAKMLSERLGEEEIRYKQRSRNTGKKASTTISDQERTKALIAPADLVKFDFGDRIIISPGFKKGKEAYIPIRDTGVVSYGLERTIAESKALWPKIKERMIKRSAQHPVTAEELRARYMAALEMLPLPDDHREQQGEEMMQNPLESELEANSSTLEEDL